MVEVNMASIFGLMAVILAIGIIIWFIKELVLGWR